MIDKLQKVNNILDTYDQKHLIRFYDELDASKKEALLDQILSIDFEQIFKLYDNSMKTEKLAPNELSPLEYFIKKDFTKEEFDNYSKTGENLVKNGNFAVITMAGGQGTRLGYKGPKGTYKLDFKPEKKSLFQIMCEDIKRANEKYGVVIPWYIMTSEENDSQTKAFFEENNYWNYPKESVKFFTQGKLPIITVDKKLILQEPYLVKEASNGNGNVFVSMKKHGILEDLEKNNIKWVSFGGIDNVLLKNVDTFFLGLAIDKNYSIASKSIFKRKPMEKTAVYCRKFGKPSILDYDDISISLSVSRDINGRYLYRDANILSHLMNIDAIKKVSKLNLRYHRAYKKNSFVNEEGMKQVPDGPNTFKFENFIFDAFSYFDDMLLLRVNSDEEFAPIKDFNGIFNPETAKEKYQNYWNTHQFES